MTRIVVIMKIKLVNNGGGFMPLYNHLKEYRARLGVNQQQMGMLCGTSRQTISQIERGDYSPSVSLALKIAKVCDAKVEDIFEYEEDES
jgi:putative transcriptional regulator